MRVVKKHWRKGDKILVTYASENWDYRCARIMYIAGKQNARPGSVGTIVSPRQAKGVIIDSGIPDVKIVSFNFEGKPRQFLFKIAEMGSGCTVRLIKPRVNSKWKSLSGDVTLVDGNGDPILKNPHALVEWGDMLYLIDYESHKIVILGADELEGMSGKYLPMKHPFNFDAQTPPLDPAIPTNAKGQALAALENKLFALYQCPNAESPSGTGYDPSILCRLAIGSDGNLTYEAQTKVGRNARGFSVVNDGTQNYLLIHAIGGTQKMDGTTNGTYSNVCCVPALGDWPNEADILITGDPVDGDGKSTQGTYNILSVGAATRGRTSMLYLLTQVYLTNEEDESQDALWKLYEITVGEFLDLASDPDAPLTITGALGKGLSVTDEGVVESLKDEGIYFWDVLYGQAPGVNDADDRLWVILGTPLLVTRAARGEYGSPTSDSENAYLVIGFNGGHNNNSIDLTIETITQGERDDGICQRRSMHGATMAESAK
jgi:hypothetical protein